MSALAGAASGIFFCTWTKGWEGGDGFVLRLVLRPLFFRIANFQGEFAVLLNETRVSEFAVTSRNMGKSGFNDA